MPKKLLIGTGCVAAAVLAVVALARVYVTPRPGSTLTQTRQPFEYFGLKRWTFDIRLPRSRGADEMVGLQIRKRSYDKEGQPNPAAGFLGQEDSEAISGSAALSISPDGGADPRNVTVVLLDVDNLSTEDSSKGSFRISGGLQMGAASTPLKSSATFCEGFINSTSVSTHSEWTGKELHLMTFTTSDAENSFRYDVVLVIRNGNSSL